MATRSSRKRKASLPLGRAAREVRVRLGLLALDNIDLPKHTYSATIFVEASWEVCRTPMTVLAPQIPSLREKTSSATLTHSCLERIFAVEPLIHHYFIAGSFLVKKGRFSHIFGALATAGAIFTHG